MPKPTKKQERTLLSFLNLILKMLYNIILIHYFKDDIQKSIFSNTSLSLETVNSLYQMVAGYVKI